MTQRIPVLLRRADPKSDIPFVTNSWLKSYRDAFAVAGIPNRLYYYYHHKVLEHLLPRSVVVVACSEDDSDQILGWIAAEMLENQVLVIHYCYVKSTFRGLGIASMLVDTLLKSEAPSAVMYTHRTKSSSAIERTKEWVYHPYLVWLSLPEGWESESNQAGSTKAGRESREAD